MSRLIALRILYERSPLIFLGAGIALVGVLFGIGEITERLTQGQASVPLWQTALIVAGTVAKYAFAAGIIAWLTRTMVLEGYFRDALSGIVDQEVKQELTAFKEDVRTICGDVVSTQLGNFQPTVRDICESVFLNEEIQGRRKQLEDLWRNITQQVLLPGFVKPGHDPKFLDDLNESLSAVLKNRQPYYVDDMDRTYTFKLENETLLIREQSSFVLVPFDPSKELDYKMRYMAAVGNEISDYGLDHILFTVDGEDRLPTFTPGIGRLTEQEEKAISIPLSGSTKYHIQRITNIRQRLDEDPLFFCSQDHICRWKKLTILCQDPNLVAKFEEAGT